MTLACAYCDEKITGSEQMKRILVIHKGELRHRALSNFLSMSGFDVCTLIEKSARLQENPTSVPDTLRRHFNARNQAESDFFSLINSCQLALPSIHEIALLEGDANEQAAIDIANGFSPEYIVTFGCSILKEPWISTFRDQIIGIHLGLSPYYRGAGTNFFPFVNSELGAVGATLMRLDEGVDTGDVFHQIRARIVTGDTIHSIGNRLIQDLIINLAEILRLSPNLAASKPLPAVPGRVYRTRDFTDSTLKVASDNLRNGLIDAYLSNQDEENAKFPLVRVFGQL